MSADVLRAAPARVWSHASGDDGRPLVVLVHGTMDRSAGMLRLARRLDDRFRVIRYDRRGYGRSAELGAPFGIEQQVTDLTTVLAGRRALVFGHSFGGNIALGLADRRPELVAAVATYESPTAWMPWWPGWYPEDRRRYPDSAPEERADRFLGVVLGRARWEALPDPVRAARRLDGIPMCGELGALDGVEPWRAERIVAPVVVGVGDRAGAAQRRAAQHVAELIGGAEEVVLAGCHHDAPHASPDVVADELVLRAARRAGDPWAGAADASVRRPG